MQTLTQIALILSVVLSGCAIQPVRFPNADQTPIAAVHRFSPETRNSTQAEEAPYVILIAIDGFRFDYAKKHNAKNLLEIQKYGVAAEGLVPVYPSETFPNMYTLITGLRPKDHGLVSNHFYDTDLNDDFRLRKEKIDDSKWYGGEPLWVTAQKNGFISASYFWVGDENLIAGSKPNYYATYEKSVDNIARVQQVMQWLNLAAVERPHLISLYFSSVDSASHEHGPNSIEVTNAVNDVDAAIGLLRAEIERLKLPVNLIIVSDHGFEEVDPNEFYFLDDKVDLTAFDSKGWGSQILYYLKPDRSTSEISKAVKGLRKLKGPFQVWTRSDYGHFYYEGSNRTGDFLIEALPPVLIAPNKQMAKKENGEHGWDPRRTPNMNGFFAASGPSFKKGIVLPSVKNLDIYPLVSHVLGFKKTPITPGNIRSFQPALMGMP